MYSQIELYQTRTLRLHGANDCPDRPLVCSLYVADILHPTFEGLGLRALPGEADRRVEYEALSYTWGGEQSAASISCNGNLFRVTENLFEALKTLRHPHSEDRYLWIDAVCINQKDPSEKAVQVRNMLTIYQKATRVMAWLGAEPKDLEAVIKAAASFSSKSILRS
jgi:hypothetical protein